MNGNKIIKQDQLIDRFGRIHNYLRLSITDACNFACTYCMPDNKQSELSGGKMSAAEIIEIAKAFKSFGINKIRLTGGEPTVHKDFDLIIRELGKLQLDLALTTNGYLLDQHFNNLHKSGFRKINISLDTLQSNKFKSITQRNAFDRVFTNLVLATKIGFEVKVNAVIMRNTNDDELLEFAKLSEKYPLTVRFIEFMPFKDNSWNFGKSFSENDMLQKLSSVYSLTKEDSRQGETASYYRINKSQGRIGMISSISKPFCRNCNRIRVMADGKMKNCLFGKGEFDLIGAYRQGADLKQVIQHALVQKEEYHGGNKTIANSTPDVNENRNMYSIGG